MSQAVFSIQSFSVAEKRKLQRLEEDLPHCIQEARKQTDVIDIMIDPSGKIFADRLGTGIEQIGTILPSEAEALCKVIATQMPPQVQIMLWLNEHFGPISFDGKTFEEMKAYKAHKERLAGIIQIPQQQSLFIRNLRTMLDRFLTFDEAITSPDFRLLEKQRLTMVRHELFEKMAVAL